MQITEKNKVKVFRKDGQYGAMYSIGLSKKKTDGTYENGYMSVRFKNGVELENQTEIYIKDAWLSFNKKEDKTYPFIFINHFTTIEDAIEQAKEQPKEEEPTKVYTKDIQVDLFEDFGKEIEDKNDLPF